jgi:hypothetical protein
VEVPAKTLWFSKIAAYSDLAVYIREENQNFASVQQMEIQFYRKRS